jgi:hypothetical protein
MHNYLAESVTYIGVHNTGLLRFVTFKPLHTLFMEVCTNIVLLESIPLLYGGFYFHKTKSVKWQAYEFYV